MSEALLDLFIYNGKIYKTKEFDYLYHDKSPSLYEVIRIVDGVPLFLEEHYERLINSARIINYSLEISIEAIRENIIKMVRFNKIKDHNIKIVINNLDGNELNQYYFFIKSEYPSMDMYNEGVSTITYSAVRDNPNAKIINKKLRENVNKLLKEKECYEALLINENGEITEGSRSNTFFIKDSTVYTSPSEGVLLGVTRQRIISLCRKNNISVIEEPINMDSLSSFEAVFMSGTSPKVLPIKRVDDLKFDVRNDLLLKVMKIYDEEINSYINKHK